MSDSHVPVQGAPPQKGQNKFAVWHPDSGTVHLPFVVTRYENGNILTAVAKPKLQMSQGHIAALPLGPYDKEYQQKMPVWIATADGLRYANQWAGWQVTFPETVNVPGLGFQANPYIETDKAGAFVKGFARAIGIGRTALTGSLMIIDRPVHISIQSYIEEDFASKAQFHPTSIVWGSKGMNPMDAVEGAVETRNAEIDSQIEEYEKKGWNTAKIGKGKIHEEAITKAEAQYRNGLWKFYPIIGDDVGMWVNLASPVVTGILKTMVQKRKFGSRLLPSIAERNVLRTALGFYRAPEGIVRENWPLRMANGNFQGKPKVIDATWSPPVTVHRSEFRPHEILGLRKNYLLGMRGGLLGGPDVQFDHQLEDASSEDMVLMAPQDAAIDHTEAPEILTMAGTQVMDGVSEELDERTKLLVEARKYLSMMTTETADNLRHVCFKDSTRTDMNTVDVDDLRVFVTRLKQTVEFESQAPVDETKDPHKGEQEDEQEDEQKTE